MSDVLGPSDAQEGIFFAPPPQSWWSRLLTRIRLRRYLRRAVDIGYITEDE